MNAPALIPARTMLATPSLLPHGFCLLLPDFLDAASCRQLLAAAQARGFASAESDYPPSYRDNERQVLDDSALAATLLRRLHQQAGAALVEFGRQLGEGGEPWACTGLNGRLRFCHYGAGQTFHRHQDGRYFPGDGSQSRLTFLLYLNSAGEDFTGGDTVFYADGPAESAEVLRVRPQAGSLLLFDHALWHAGATVRAGHKYILRSDVLFRPATTGTQQRGFGNAHDGYVWTLARLAGGLIASGGRDTVIRLWHESGELQGSLQGHGRSVLGLAAYGEGLASVSRDQTLRLWNLGEEKARLTVQAHGAAVLCLGVQGERLLTGAADHCVKIWDGQGRALGTLQGHGGWVWALAPLGGSRWATASEDGAFCLWDIDRGRLQHRQAGSTPLRALASLPEQGLLAVGDNQGWVSIWDDGGRRLLTRFRAHTAALRCLHFRDADTLVSGGEDRECRVWRLADYALLQRQRHGNFVTALLAAEDGGFFSCSYDGSIRLPFSRELEALGPRVRGGDGEIFRPRR